MRKKAFTIIELMIALFIFSIGIVGSFALLRNIAISSSISASRLTATFLAREGVEVIRNIRDNNYALGPPVEWDDNICFGIGFPCSSTQLSYTSNRFPQSGLGCGIPGHPCYLVYDPSEEFFVPKDAGRFKRTVSVTKPESYKMHVESCVEWKERGRTHKVCAVEDLYDWKH